MIIKLGEVASFVNGYAFKPSDWSDNGMPIIRIQDLTGNSYKMNRYNGDIEQKYKVQDGDVLISWSASLGVYVWHGENAVLNQHIFKVVFDKTDVSKDYFVYQIEYRLGNAASEAHGATMKHLTKSVFNALPFYLPKKEEQEKIAKVLNKITELTNKTRKQAKLLDDIIKSRFIELFGDPVSNPLKWDMKSLLKMGYCKNGMNFHTGDSGIEVHCLGVGDFKDYAIIDRTENLPMISLKEMPSDENMLQDGDIVFVRSNGNKALVGRCVIVYPHNILTTYSGFCIRYRLTGDEVIGIYLLQVLKTDSMRKKMAGRGANIQNLNQQILASLNIPLPPIELQNQFADFVAHVDKSKLAVQKSLDELETLKKSLMQEYFG